MKALIVTLSTFDNIANFGAGKAVTSSLGRTAYFRNRSLHLVIVPEPSALGMLACLAACSGLLL